MNFAAGDPVADYVQISGGNYKTVQVDIDGAGSAAGFQDLVLLTNASGVTTAQDLFDNGLLYL